MIASPGGLAIGGYRGISQIYYDLQYNVDWKKIVCYNVQYQSMRQNK